MAKAERAAFMAGVSVRTWRARFTLSERTFVDFISMGCSVLMILFGGVCS